MTTKPRIKLKPESKSVSESPTPHKPTSWRNPIYQASFCDEIQHLYAAGATDVKCAVHCGVCKETYYEWMYQYPDFKKAVMHGKALSHKYWAEMGQAGAEATRKIEPKIWHLFMRNAHGWDKDPIAAAPATSEQVDAMSSKIDDLMSKFKQDF